MHSSNLDYFPISMISGIFCNYYFGIFWLLLVVLSKVIIPSTRKYNKLLIDFSKLYNAVVILKWEKYVSLTNAHRLLLPAVHLQCGSYPWIPQTIVLFIFSFTSSGKRFRFVPWLGVRIWLWDVFLGIHPSTICLRYGQHQAK